MSSNADAAITFPVQAAITEHLTSTFRPNHLDVRNESHMHNVPANSETHFKVVVVSEDFAGLNLVQRHRKVHAALEAELQGSVHALSIVAKTPAQWQQMVDKGTDIPASPSCRGGDGSLPPKHTAPKES